MISMDSRPIEFVEPASPASSKAGPGSPEIRVTDTPEPPLSPASSSNNSFSNLTASPNSALTQSSSTMATPFQPFQSGFLPHSLAAAAAMAAAVAQQHQQTMAAAASSTTTTTSSSSPSSTSHEDNVPRRTLPFSIDNILKPNFGPRLLFAAAAAASRHHHHHQQQQQQEQEKLQKKPPSVKVPKPVKPTASNKPVDLSSKTNVNNNNNNNNTSSSGSSDKKDGDVPPGMVRGPNGQLWPAWVFCTRYSDRPSSGPRPRKIKKKERTTSSASGSGSEEKRPRTAFSAEQLARLRKEFEENRYLNEDRRKSLANELGLNETQIKIWFQNKRAKLKKASGDKGDLAKLLAAQGLYNHATVAVDDEEFPNI